MTNRSKATPQNTNRVIGYVRVSTDEQARDGVSLEAQAAKVRAYCALYDLELVDVVADPGASAKTLDRPGLQTVLARLRAGEAGGLVVAKLDRLTRSVSDMDRLIRDYFGERARHAVSLQSVADQVDTRTAAGRLVLNVLMSVAQWEREAIGERTRDALAHKASKGERVSGRVPYGFRLADDGVHLESNPDEQEVIATVRELRAAGLSQRGIVAALAKRGLCNREGNRFALAAVQNMLARAA